MTLDADKLIAEAKDLQSFDDIEQFLTVYMVELQTLKKQAEYELVDNYQVIFKILEKKEAEFKKVCH